MKNLAYSLIAAASGAFLAAGVAEKALHRRALRAIPIRVMVNGTRGKTSVTRLVAAALREAGLRTWAKTTGTQAAWILPDGSEQEYRKKRPVNIREQIPFVRRAARDGADAIVVECMALHPENQRMMAEEFVRPTVEIITNARVDHISEIGATEEETVATLSLSILEGARVVTGDARFDEYTAGRVDPSDLEIDGGYVDSFPYPMFEDNVRQALCAAMLLGVDRETALRGMRRARPDAGMCGPFRVGGCTVINGFAANDLESSRALFEKTVALRGLEGQPVWVLFNNRGDREFRLAEFVPLMREMAGRGASLRVVGENTAKAARFFERKAGIAAQPLEGDALSWLEKLGEENCTVLCIGNIRGAGRALIEALQARCDAEEKPNGERAESRAGAQSADFAEMDRRDAQTGEGTAAHLNSDGAAALAQNTDDKGESPAGRADRA